VLVVEDAAEAVASADVQLGDCALIGDRFGKRVQRPGVRDTSMESGAADRGYGEACVEDEHALAIADRR
jgi:hypothetical protein